MGYPKQTEYLKSASAGVEHDAAITINESGNAVDFRVESDNKTHMLVVDGSANRVGIGLTGDPEAVLDIATGNTGNQLCILVQEDASNQQSILFREAGYSNFALQYDGTNSAPNNLFKIRSADGADGVIDVDALTVSQSGAVEFSDSLTVNEISAPSTPASGKGVIYAKSDNKLYFKNDAGTETDLTGGGQTVGSVALTDAANIATDASLGNVFTVTLGGNRTLDNPTNLTVGHEYLWRIQQDGTGSRTLAYGSYFKWAGGSAPVLTTTANAVDVIVVTCTSSTELIASAEFNFS